MLRRQTRLKREYLYRKSIEVRQRAIQEKKSRLKKALDEHHVIDSDLRKDALTLQESLDWDDEGPKLAANLGDETGGGGLMTSADDEYRWAGVEDPKVILTTSRDPSARLKMFIKELKLLIPNSQRMNRGNYEMKRLIQACRANQVTDFIIVHEHRGKPDGLVVCHLPYGPAAYFTLSDVVMRHDVPNLGTMSEQYPHLIFHNFKTTLGQRVTNILKFLFPVPKEDSRRVVTFANHDDSISFRQHTYKRAEGGKDVEMTENGPRFQMKLYQIKLGTLDSEASADTEWAYRPYMNTTKKRRFLSDADGWVE